MLVTQQAICKYVSCATCYFAHGLDSGDDHFNCLLQGESIYDLPELTVCPCYREDFADMLAVELFTRLRVKTSQRVSA